MNVCNLRKADIEELDMIVKTAFRKEGFHGKQTSDERVYAKREDGGRGMKKLQGGIRRNESKGSMLCGNIEQRVDQSSMEKRVPERANIIEREAGEAMQRVNARVKFNRGDIKIGNEGYSNWKAA